jgi:hypothetical protein
MRNAYKVLTGKQKRRHQPGDLGVGGKIILDWILEE